MAIYSNNVITKDLFNNDPTFWDDDPAECNCGSYALNIVDWYYPYEDRTTRDNWIESMLDNGFTMDEAREEVLAEDVYNTGCGAAILSGMTEQYELLMRATKSAFLDAFPQDIGVWNAAEEKFRKKHGLE